MPNRRSMRGARKSQPSAGEMPKKRRRNRRRGQAGPSAQLLRFTPNLPFPESVRTTFFCEADYKIAIATASITSGAVKLNSPWLPFRPGASSAFSSYTFLGPATEATLLPTGWSVLATANLYQFYKVLRSTIRIRWSGANSSNNVVVTVIPTFDVASFSSIYTARAAPMARQATFSVSKQSTGVDRDGWFTYSFDPYKLYAATRSEEKGDLVSGGGTYNTDPLVVLWWQVFVQSTDLDVSATTASLFQVKVKYDVELFGLTQSVVTSAALPTTLAPSETKVGVGEEEGEQAISRLSLSSVPSGRAPDGDHMMHKMALEDHRGYIVVGADPSVLRTLRRST